MGISRHPRLRLRGLVVGVLVTSAAAVHCGGASPSEPAKAAPKTPTFSETPFQEARTRCIEFSDIPSCRKALASPEAVGDERVNLLTKVCLTNMDQELCCKSYEELPYAQVTKAHAGKNPQALALATCGLFCFRANGRPPRFCEVFEGAWVRSIACVPAKATTATTSSAAASTPPRAPRSARASRASKSRRRPSKPGSPRTSRPAKRETSRPPAA